MAITFNNMGEEQNTQPNSEAQDFDGVRFSPQFSIALKDFIKKNAPAPKVAHGNTNIVGNTPDVAVAHGLGAKPNFISWSPNPFYDGVNGLSTNYLSTTVADATNFYVSSYGALTRSAEWYAAIL